MNESYEVISSNDAIDDPANWVYDIFPFDPKKEMKMIINKSKIAMPDLEDPGFATKIIRKNLDATDGLLKINIYYNK